MAGEGTFGEPPPACPADFTDYVAYPSVVLVFFCVTLISAIFACVCVLRYNKVQVLMKNISSSKISNTAWVFYFVCLSFSSLIIAIQYSIDPDVSTTWENILLATGFLLHGFVTFALTFALHHQWRFRSGRDQPSVSGEIESERSLKGLYGTVSSTSAFSQKFQQIKARLGFAEFFYIMLLILYLLSASFMFIFDFNDIAEIIFLAVYFCQQIPSVVLIVVILIYQKSDGSGPKVSSKVFLALGALFGLAGELPLNIWALILPDNCIFVIGSWVDLIHIIYCSSILFFFLFIRSEYRRNRDEYHWNAVNAFQSSW